MSNLGFIIRGQGKRGEKEKIRKRRGGEMIYRSLRMIRIMWARVLRV